MQERQEDTVSDRTQRVEWMIGNTITAMTFLIDRNNKY